MPKNRFSDVARESASKTNETLASELTELTPITKDELMKMLPKKSDKEHFALLMAIVSSSSSTNHKIAELKRNLDKLGPVLVRTLKLFT